MGVALDPAPRCSLLVGCRGTPRSRSSAVARIAEVPRVTATRIGGDHRAARTRSRRRGGRSPSTAPRLRATRRSRLPSRPRGPVPVPRPQIAAADPASAHRLAPQSTTPISPTASAAPESAAKSWIPRNDGSRCPGRLPSNSFTAPRNCSSAPRRRDEAPGDERAQEEAAVLPPADERRSSPARAARTSRTSRADERRPERLLVPAQCREGSTTRRRSRGRRRPRRAGTAAGRRCGEPFVAQARRSPRRRPSRRQIGEVDVDRRPPRPEIAARLVLGRGGTGTGPRQRGAAPPSSTAARPIRRRRRGPGSGACGAAKTSNYTLPPSCAHGFCGVVPRRPWGCMRPSRWDFSGPSSPPACSGSTSSASTPPR